MIEIQHGCTKVPNTEATFKYVVKSVLPANYLVDEYAVYIFEVLDELGDPCIGDFIVGTSLVRRTKPKVNPDWRMWKDKDLYGNP